MNPMKQPSCCKSPLHILCYFLIRCISNTVFPAVDFIIDKYQGQETWNRRLYISQPKQPHTSTSEWA